MSSLLQTLELGLKFLTAARSNFAADLNSKEQRQRRRVDTLTRVGLILLSMLANAISNYQVANIAYQGSGDQLGRPMSSTQGV